VVPLGDMIVKLAAIIGAAGTIIAAVAAIYKTLRRIENMLTGVMDDIADLQYERLAQAHDFYMDRGWCPASKKAQLCIIYKSYKSKGRNHLTAHYEENILSLAEEPIRKD